MRYVVASMILSSMILSSLSSSAAEPPADWQKLVIAQLDADIAAGEIAIDPTAPAAEEFDPATAPARLAVTERGAEAGIDPTQTKGLLGHLKRNWGKYLATATVAYTTDRVAANNDWWWHRESGKGGGDANDNESRTGTATAGAGGVVYNVQIGGDNYAPITVVGRDNLGDAPAAAAPEE